MGPAGGYGYGGVLGGAGATVPPSGQVGVLAAGSGGGVGYRDARGGAGVADSSAGQAGRFPAGPSGEVGYGRGAGVIGTSAGPGGRGSDTAAAWAEPEPLARILDGRTGSPWALGEVSACLLYTSPSPRDLSTSRMPSSA